MLTLGMGKHLAHMCVRGQESGIALEREWGIVQVHMFYQEQE